MACRPWLEIGAVLLYFLSSIEQDAVEAHKQAKKNWGDIQPLGPNKFDQ